MCNRYKLSCVAPGVTSPVDPAVSVMVAGDKEQINAERRMRDGIPVGLGLLAKIRQVAVESGVPFLLVEAG